MAFRAEDRMVHDEATVAVMAAEMIGSVTDGPTRGAQAVPRTSLPFDDRLPFRRAIRMDDKNDFLAIATKENACMKIE